MARRSTVPALLGLVALLIVACTDDGEGGGEPAPRESTTTTLTRPDGPVADVSDELTGGNGMFVGSVVTGEGADEPVVVEEFAAAGTASSYQAAGELTSDGQWAFEPRSEADYRTRIVVRRPEEEADFSGVVLVEWLNVSGGGNADAGWMTLHEEIVRRGHVWVGVTAQATGVNGGPVRVRIEGPGSEYQGLGLKKVDPVRYGTLEHPGDPFSYDIFTQVARALREDGHVLGGLEPKQLIAVGQSQSAFALVTYVNGVQPLTSAFDGFFVHSRGGSGLPLVEGGQDADMAAALGRPPTILRDVDVPIFEFQTEGDITSVIGSLAARQPDTDQFRLWEVAGTSHADRRLVGPAAEHIDCGVAINDGPQHVVGKAALRHLVAWVTKGKLPPEAPRIEVAEGETPEIRRDVDGIALGGVRTPPIDVPTRVLSSTQGPGDSLICLLLGSTSAITAERLTELYPSPSEYERRYSEAVDDAIDAGYVLEEDREAIEEYAHAELIDG